MLFFSTILDAPVRDSVEEVGGKVIDVLIRINHDREFPPVVGFVIKHFKSKKARFIPASAVENWGIGEIELSKKLNDVLSHMPVSEDIVSLKNTVLDKQIVDLTGMRVVRVNDLEFGSVQKVMCLIAIDVSTRGLLRRMGLRGQTINNFFHPHLLEWKNVRLVDNKLHLSIGAEELVKLHPADIANIVEKMNVSQGSVFLQSLDKSVAARVIEELQPDIKKILVRSLGTERAAALMEKMSVDELVDLIQLLPGRDSHELMSKLPLDSKTQKVKKILEYDEDTAGGLMTTEYVAVRQDMTIEQAIEEIKKVSHQHHSIQFVYVTDESAKFLGVISLRNLILANRAQKVKDAMRKPNRRLPTGKADQSLGSLAAMMTKYNLLSLAVLDKDKKLIGVVTVDDIMRRLVPKA
ncbi:magnesium transporter [Candidatus Peregrinibacteria bacterium]|nr:magnesium transporter [Candidatus Peregrinibacteria bacterium]